jgi:hypothetical protein
MTLFAFIPFQPGNSLAIVGIVIAVVVVAVALYISTHFKPKG